MLPALLMLLLSPGDRQERHAWEMVIFANRAAKHLEEHLPKALPKPVVFKGLAYQSLYTKAFIQDEGTYYSVYINRWYLYIAGKDSIRETVAHELCHAVNDSDVIPTWGELTKAEQDWRHLGNNICLWSVLTDHDQRHGRSLP